MSDFQSTQKPAYTGIENLEIMKEARNYNNFIIKIIRKYAPKNLDANIYDFGAGTGQFSLIWEGINDKFKAIEIDPLLRKNLENKGIRVVTLDDIQKNSAEFIYSINVLEHIERDTEILDKLYEKMKPGCKILVYVPAFNFLWTAMDDAVCHVRRYDRKSLERKFLASGFITDRLSYVDSAGFFATLIFKIFSKANGTLNPTLVKIFDVYFFPLGRVLDNLFFENIFGKNLLIVAHKPEDE